VGTLDATLRRLARGLGLEQVEGLPPHAAAPPPELGQEFVEQARAAPLAALIDALLAVGILAPTEAATLALSARFVEELHAPGGEDAPSLFERLAPLHADMNLLMRRFI
jgi:hypothetical protein